MRTYIIACGTQYLGDIKYVFEGTDIWLVKSVNESSDTDIISYKFLLWIVTNGIVNQTTYQH